MTKPLEEHARNWDLRHEDFNDNDFLYAVYSVMRDRNAFSHTDTPFLSATPGGAWVATRQQKFRKVLNPYFSPARMKALTPQIRRETDQLIDVFIERGEGDLADVAWRQPGAVVPRSTARSWPSPISPPIPTSTERAVGHMTCRQSWMSTPAAGYHGLSPSL